MNKKHTFKKYQSETFDFVDLVGLNEPQFRLLCNEFILDWNDYIQHFTLKGKLRERSNSKRKNDVLPTIEDKLFFILIYLKNKPTSLEHAKSYAMDQPQAYIWIKLLESILRKTIKRMENHITISY